MSEWYRGEDARNLKRSELNEVVENLTCLNAFEVKIWKSDEKVVMDDKFNQKIVMNENSWKNFVMNAKIDPKVVMDLSIFKIGGFGTVCNSSINIGRKNLLTRMNRGCSSEFQAEIHSL